MLLKRVIPLDNSENEIFNTDYEEVIGYIKHIIIHLIASKEETE